LRQVALEGVERIDSHSFRVRIRGSYPQFVYWLAMPFFAPVPWEAEKFYAQPGMAEKNFTLDWWPVGTGAYMLTENNPNSRMVLERNPNYHGEEYPREGEPDDAAAGLLADAGKALPFIDKVVFSREKEGIPYWNKFLQGYYDTSGIGSDQFDQAVRVSIEGDTNVTAEMEEKGIRLSTSVETTTGYVAFNWLDPVVGGSSERARKLRHAISIAFDVEEQITIFANGRGIPAQGPIAPEIFGYREGQEGVNPVVYDWVDGKPERKSLEVAKRLLAEAGYPGGSDAMSGQPLVIYLETVVRGSGYKASFDC
jgi:oligopeptide transport system substrate-binding protein